MQTEQFILLWVLFVMIVLGNISVLVALVLNKNRKSRMNFFIMQLAIADLAVGLINVLTDIIWRMTITWHAGNLGCKIIRYLQAVVTYSSTYVLVALSIDRYDAIKHPMRFSGSWRRAKVLVLLAWLLSFLFSIPILLLYEEKVIQGRTQCWIELEEQWQWQVYMSSVAILVFAIPTVIISACYAIIVATIWSKSSHIVVVNHAHKRAKVGLEKYRTPHLDHDHDSRRASSRGLIPRAKVKTVKMTFVIVFVFIVCWSPYIVFDLLQVYGYIEPTQSNLAVATFIQSLAPLNSAANPIIYCLFSTHICRALRKLPPFSWLRICFPGFNTHPAHCLRYGNGNDTNSTLTETLTQHSSRRSANTTSLRHQVTIRLPPTAGHAAKAMVTVV
ncbi:Neuropeptide S receptor [Homalodisca vitripennis]|nr:Neuropeptide S receptor [Homalodisca vitripennis]